MLVYIIKRLLNMIPTLVLITIISFLIIQLPPGDFATFYMRTFEETGARIDNEEAELENIRRQFNLDKPIIVQYFLWVGGFFKGDFGYSFEWNKPVSYVISQRLPLTIMITLCSTFFVWIVGFLIGFYSATNQYSIIDYFATFFGFLGLAIPNFLLATVIMWIGFSVFGLDVGGLFSDEYLNAPWTIGKFIDLLSHLWVPVIVIGTAGTAGIIRIFRANLLDELSKPYVDTARAKGVSEGKLLIKYPVRIALLPFISTVGWTLPILISGETITSVVLSLPTTGPVLLRALRSQDMYLAGSFIMLLSFMTVIGTLVSDLLLAWADPRIRYE